MRKHVLLVDDDVGLCELLSDYLIGEGFEVSSVNRGEGALDAIKKGDYAAIVLDIMMPGLSGLEVLQKVRAAFTVPVIMLTGRGDDIDRIVGLELGADDYVGKPCNPRELAARLRAVIRRSESVMTPSPPNEPPATTVIELNRILLNTNTLESQFNGVATNLTSAEFNVLLTLMRSAGQVLSKEVLTQNALHRELTQYDRSIDVHVSRIRHKLAESGLHGDLIKAVRGVGYQMLLHEE